MSRDWQRDQERDQETRRRVGAWLIPPNPMLLLRAMLTPSHGGDPLMLRLRVFGRPIHPVGLGVSLYTAILAYAILTDAALGQLLDGPIGEAIGIVCAAATVWLWAGWWARRRDWLQHGLVWATVGITATATTVVIDVGWGSVSAWLSAPVAIIAFGSWLLERADPQGRR